MLILVFQHLSWCVLLRWRDTPFACALWHTDS